MGSCSIRDQLSAPFSIANTSALSSVACEAAPGRASQSWNSTGASDRSLNHRQRIRTPSIDDLVRLIPHVAYQPLLDQRPEVSRIDHLSGFSVGDDRNVLPRALPPGTWKTSPLPELMIHPRSRTYSPIEEDSSRLARSGRDGVRCQPRSIHP